MCLEEIDGTFTVLVSNRQSCLQSICHNDTEDWTSHTYRERERDAGRPSNTDEVNQDKAKLSPLMSHYHSYFLFICLAILMTLSLWKRSTCTLVIQYKTLSTSRSRYIFLSKIFCIRLIIRRTAVNHGCEREDRKQLPLKQHWCSCTPHALCLNLDALCSVCTQFKLADQYARAVSGQQLPSSAFGPVLPHQMSKCSRSECFGGGEIVLGKHY